MRSNFFQRLLVSGPAAAGGADRWLSPGIFAGIRGAVLAFAILACSLAATQAAAPSITLQPKSVAVDEGDDATLSVDASGDAPLSFQWRFKGSLIRGATAKTYVVKAVNTANAGNYDVIVTNGSGSVPSSVATVSVKFLDWGDAPASYGTLRVDDGARHEIVAGFMLGSKIDSEAEGQAGPNADGDDLNPSTNDDEDGVVFPTLVPGAQATVQITVRDDTGGQSRVDLFIDFNGNGSWLESNEHFVLNLPKVGQNSLTFTVPANAVPGNTFARVRLSRSGTDLPTGRARDGEVEDYKVTIIRYDFGDAPEVSGTAVAGYPTTLSRDGARHRILNGFFLGSGVDSEPNGQPSADALGDDKNPSTLDDEDGVVFPSKLIPGQSAQILVTASSAGKLDAWVDFNKNSSWADPGEQILNTFQLAAGVNTLSVSVPGNAATGDTFARFRLSRQGGLSFVGEAADGEVEDYKVTISVPLLDYGDAPESQSPLGFFGYPTSKANNGASHQLLPGFHLGRLADDEEDGQPDADALGDDNSPAGTLNDEDGVKFLSPLVPGQTAQVEVTASAQGLLDAWIDYNGNQSWSDPAEQVFTTTVLAPGANILTILVPATATPGVTFARFRFSKEGRQLPTGFGGIGEVEDYKVTIDRKPTGGCDQGCGGDDFWLTFPGNYAPDPGNPTQVSLNIVGDKGTVVKISGPGVPAPFSRSMTSSLEVVDFPLPPAPGVDLGLTNDAVTKLGVHVEASAPVSIYVMNHAAQTSDGYLALPTEVLGTAYLVQSYPNVLHGVPELNGSQFAIVATQDGTKISITPSSVTGTHDSGVPYLIKLDQGQTYQLRNTYDAPSDLSGTLVHSDKPVAVFGSHRCANIQSFDTFFCDYLVEELVPIKKWGTEYYTFPLKTRSGGDAVRIMAVLADTHVKINGVDVAVLGFGQTYETLLDAPAAITADKRIHVTQYATSSDHDGVATADPFMVQIQHAGQFGASYKFATAQADFAANWINIVAPTAVAAAGGVLHNGVAVPPGAFTAIGASGFSGASVPVSVGVHTVKASQPVGVIVYGWSIFDSYAWPACFAFGDVTPPTLIPPQPQTVTLGAQTGGVPTDACAVAVPDFRSSVVVRDLCDRELNFVVAQSPAPGTLVGPGAHVVTFASSDSSDNVGTGATTFTVIDPNGNADPTLLCPTDMVVRRVGGPGASVEFDVVGKAGCAVLAVECDPPSGSFFKCGTTVVHCRLKDHPEITCQFAVTILCDLSNIVVGRAADKVTLSWEGAGVIQHADFVQGPWSDVDPAPAGRISVPATASQKFYRLRQ